MKGNFKVRCLDTRSCGCYAKGKVYEIKDGKMTLDNGDIYNRKFSTFQDLQSWSVAEWELVTDTKEITIRQKGRKVIAVMTEDGKYIKSAKAKYNPNDEKEGLPFDFEIGAKLAFDRLMGRVGQLNLKTTNPSFDWEGFKQGKFAVHCDTEEKANAFLKECDEQGIIWNDGEKTTAKNFYNSCKSDTCYSVYDVSKRLGFSRIGYCKEKGINVINYTSSQPSIREVKRPAEVDEWVKIVNAEKGEKYKNGDIMKITHIALGCRHYGHGFSDYLMEDEYVVLENYQPEETTRPSLSMYTDKELIDELAKRWEDKQ